MHQRTRTTRSRAPGRRVNATGRAGFTLVELMIATFLLTVGILATVQVFAVADKHVAFARQETIATALAQEIQEKIMSETFGDIVSIFDGIDTDDPGSVSSPAQEWAQHVTDRLGAEGRGTVQVLTPDNDESLPYGSVGVTVTLSWREGTQTIELPLRFTIAKIGA